MKLDLNLSLTQKLVLSQNQIQSLQLLNMDNIELNDFLLNEFLENPIMEHKEEDGFTVKEPFDFYKQASGTAEGVHSDDRADGKREFIADDRSKIRDFIKGQLDRKKYSSEHWGIISFLIECLDENGLLGVDEDEIARLLHKDVVLIHNLLIELRTLEPYGIFERDLAHCLIRQLEAAHKLDEHLRVIILHHLNHVGDRNIGAISRSLNLSTLQVRKYIAVIEQLNPRPLAGFHAEAAEYILPDIIYHQNGVQWEIQLNDRWLGSYGVNHYYMKMMKETKDAELLTYFKGKFERASFIIQSIENRRITLLQIAGAIFEHQKDFFEGKSALRPMTMSGLAESLGIHSSTVSRAVHGKYIQIPRETILMKSLFSAGLPMALDDNVSQSEIKMRIKFMIGEEYKKKPLSDQKLTDMLGLEGIQISRRAVAKYREELGIRNSAGRKQI